jgi:hypothetical protein
MYVFAAARAKADAALLTCITQNTTITADQTEATEAEADISS